MPPGEYFIGDLFYVMSDVWIEARKLFIDGGKIISREFTLDDGRRFALYKTASNEFTCRSNIHTYHPIDSNTIGCVLTSDISDLNYDDEKVTDYGGLVYFDESFTPETDGVNVRFGRIVIDTKNHIDPPDEISSIFRVLNTNV